MSERLFRFWNEFRCNIVRLVVTDGYPVEDVARAVDLDKETIERWVDQCTAPVQERVGRATIEELRAENMQLRYELKIARSIRSKSL
jgi:transposase-like protein